MAKHEVDQHMVEELVLYAENTSELYNQRKSIETNLTRKILAGKFNLELSKKLWLHWFNAAAKRYDKEFPGTQISVADRKAAADEMATRFAQEFHFSTQLSLYSHDVIITRQPGADNINWIVQLKGVMTAYRDDEGVHHTPHQWNIIARTYKGMLSIAKRYVKEWVAHEKKASKERVKMRSAKPHANVKPFGGRSEKSMSGVARSLLVDYVTGETIRQVNDSDEWHLKEAIAAKGDLKTWFDPTLKREVFIKRLDANGETLTIAQDRGKSAKSPAYRVYMTTEGMWLGRGDKFTVMRHKAAKFRSVGAARDHLRARDIVRPAVFAPDDKTVSGR